MCGSASDLVAIKADGSSTGVNENDEFWKDLVDGTGLFLCVDRSQELPQIEDNPQWSYAMHSYTVQYIESNHPLPVANL